MLRGIPSYSFKYLIPLGLEAATICSTAKKRGHTPFLTRLPMELVHTVTGQSSSIQNSSDVLKLASTSDRKIYLGLPHPVILCFVTQIKTSRTGFSFFLSFHKRHTFLLKMAWFEAFPKQHQIVKQTILINIKSAKICFVLQNAVKKQKFFSPYS